MSAHSDFNPNGKRQAETQGSHDRSQKRPRTEEEVLLQRVKELRETNPFLDSLVPAELDILLDLMTAKEPYVKGGVEVLEAGIPKPDSLTDPGTISVLSTLNAVLAEMVPLYRSALALQEIFEETGDTFYDRDQAIMHGRRARTPSEAAKASDVASEQRKHPMAIGRPFETTGPPIFIYHTVFSDFKALMEGPDAAPPQDVVTAFSLIQAAATVYRSEDDRLNAMRPFIEALLDRPFVRLPDPGQSFEPDGLILGRTIAGLVPLLVMEAENEIAPGGRDPDIQGAFSFRKLWVEEKSPQSKIRNVCCCPSFVLSVTGPRIGMHGAIFADQFIVQPLTEMLGLANYPNPYGRAEYIAKVMVALRRCLATLENFYDSLIPADTPQRADFSPVFRQFDSGDGEKTTLTYTSCNLLSSPFGRAMFDAQAKRPSDEMSISVKVKFTRQYGQEAHALLAKLNLAPKLHHCEKLKDGWMVVVMDSIEGQDMESANLRRLPPSAFEDVERAICALHEEGWVFGDLRPPNIMLYMMRDSVGGGIRKGAMLVDFDWAGKENEQRYPPSLNPDIEWPEGAVGWGLIRMEHDDRMLELLKAGEL